MAAAFRTSLAMAGSWMRYALAICEQLPRVADVYRAGDIDYDFVRDRQPTIWHGEAGMAEVAGTVFSSDAEALDNRLDELAPSVCEADPRTTQQRRADALDALAAGLDRLSCRCGNPQCCAGGVAPAGNVTIHVLADQASLDGSSDRPGYLARAEQLNPAELVAELAEQAR